MKDIFHVLSNGVFARAVYDNESHVTRAGLVIGHTGHFPGGPTH